MEDAAEWVVDTVQGNLESRKNVTTPATISSATTKATAKATTSVLASQSQATGAHAEAVITPGSMATKCFVGSGCAAVVAIGYSALLFLV